MIRNFVTPHCHQQSLDSGSTPESFAKRELELGTEAITCTDHGTLAAIPKVYELAKKNKLIPILGCELFVRDDNDPILAASGVEKVDGKYDKYNKYCHLTAHALDQNGYETLVKVLSRADKNNSETHGSERKPILTWSDLEELGSKNITVGSSCLIGMVQRHLHASDESRRPDIAIKYYKHLKEIFKPGNFYVEVFPHKCDRYWVNGCALTLEDGTILRYHKGKTFRTNEAEIKGEELAKVFSKGKHETLIGIKNRFTWEDLPPRKIVNVEVQEGFLQNECTKWAPNGDIQADANKFMLDLAARYHDPVLCSDDAHFAHPEEQMVQNIRLLQGKDRTANWRFANSYHRQSSDEAFEYFKNEMGIQQAQFEGWVDNSYEWASRFKDFKLEPRNSLPVSFYPADTLKHTFELIKKHGRMNWDNKEYVSRLNQEIKLLHKNGTIDLLPYFFLCEDTCEVYSNSKVLSGPGRGSGSGVLLTYLLGITHVDPIEYKLSLDRFLTLDRIKSGKLPDIDMDFPSRDLLVGTDGNGGWLKEKFGDCFAQLSTDNTLKLKSSIKDVARVLHNGRVPDDIEVITKKLPMPPQGILDSDFCYGYKAADGSWIPGLVDTDPFLKLYIKNYPKDWEVVKMCLSLCVRKGRHASGFLISNEPVSNFIPTTQISDITCTQYNGAGVEAVGGLKMDLLCVNALNDISGALKLIQNNNAIEDTVIDGKKVPGFRILPHGGKLFDIWELPADQNVYNDICTGDTATVFQFNTPGAKQWLREFDYVKETDSNGVKHKALDSILTLAAFTALDRPGPLDAQLSCNCHVEKKHNMLVEYANRLKGLPKSPDILPIFDELLPDTKGTLIFQENIQYLYQQLTGCSGSEAEEFRSNVAKKKMDKVQKAYPFFVEKATAKIGEENAKKVFEFFSTWGQYGFNCLYAGQMVDTEFGAMSLSSLLLEENKDTKVWYCDEYGALHKEKPTIVAETGNSEVWCVELENNRYVQATPNHEFFYEGNWVKLSDLVNIGYMEYNDGFGHFEKLRILSSESMGIQPTIDLEMPSNHNVLLYNGVVAHNCSHAVSYVKISYATAFLKHHFPLQWWTAVLSNASKNEINEKFWTECGHLIDLPDLRLSGKDFTIHGERIRAPLSLLQGIAETGQEEIVKYTEATDIQDFCHRVQAYKISKAKTNEAGKVSLGRSAITRATIYKLIICGSMDSLFPPDTSVLDQFRMYEEAKAIAESVGKKKAVKPKPVDERYTDLDMRTRFQLKKSILPAYSCPLLPLFEGMDGLNTEGRVPTYKWFDNKNDDVRSLHVGNAKIVDTYENKQPWPTDFRVTLAVPVYVVEDERRVFGNEKKQMCKLTLDVDGTRYTLVKWPDKTGKLPDTWPGNLTGSLAMVIMTKWTDQKPFNVDDIIVVQPHFTFKEEESKE